MQKCTARSSKGEPCRAAASSGGLCFFHGNPDRAKQLGHLGGRTNRKSSGVEFRLPEKPTATDLRDVMTQTINAVLSGELQHREAMAIANLVKAHSSISLDVDLENRVAKLELESVKSALQQQNVMSERGKEDGTEADEDDERQRDVGSATVSVTGEPGKGADDTDSSGTIESSDLVETGDGVAGDVDAQQVTPSEAQTDGDADSEDN